MPKTTTGSPWHDPRTGDLYARVSYIDPKTGKRKDRKRKTKNNTMTEMRQLCKAMVRELDDAGPQALDASNTTFDRLADHYIKTHCVAPVYHGSTQVHGLRTYEDHTRIVESLRRRFKHTPIREITHGELYQYRLKLLAAPVVIRKASGEVTHTRERSIASVDKSMSTLHRMFMIAMGENWLLRDPFTGPHKLVTQGEQTKRDRAMSHEEEIRLLDQCVEPREHLLYKVVCATDTGMRLGEIETLMWEDIDIQKRQINIKGFDFHARQAVTKTIQSRVVPISDRLLGVLVIIAGDRWNQYSASTVGNRGRVFGAASMKTAWATAKRNAEIEDLHFHDLRHTFATRLIDMQIDPVVIAKLLGHSTPTSETAATVSKTTMRYISITPEMLERVLAAVNAQELKRETLRKRQDTFVSGTYTSHLLDENVASLPDNTQDTADSLAM